MDSISGLLPAIISFIVFANIIEFLIKLFTKKGNEKEDSQKKENKKSKTGILNNDWKLQKNNKDIDNNKVSEVKEISNNNYENKLEENNKENNSFINKKGRMADYMDEEESIYEKNSGTKVKRRKKINKDFPNEIKIGETKLFNKNNIKDDIIKGIVMKEILDKPRSKKAYKSPLEK